MDVALLRSSFQAITPRADAVARAFYARLLGTFPQVRPLFAKTDFTEQRQKLLASLAAVVGLCDRPKELAPVLEKLGRSHRGYGVEAGMYPYVSFALLATLADELKERWTPELCRTWEAALSHVGAEMIRAQQAAA